MSEIARVTLEAVSEGVFFLGSDGTVRWMNPAAERILGFGREHLAEILYNTPSRVVRRDGSPCPPEERPSVLALRSGEPVTDAVIGIARASGDTRWLRVNARPVADESQAATGVIVAFVDVSDRTRAEDAARAAQTHLQHHLDNTPLAVIEWDSGSRVARFNARAEALFGWTAAEVIGLHRDEVPWVHEDDRAAEPAPRGGSEAGWHPVVTRRNRRKDGALLHCEWFDSFLFDGQGRLTSALSQVQDVSSRVQAERDLAREKSLLTAVMDGMPVGVWVTDERGVIQSGNPAAQEIWGGVRYVGVDGYPEYKAWWARTGERIKPDEWAVARALAHGVASVDEEVLIETFDGQRKFILNSGVPIRDEDGTVRGAVVVNHDVTERRAIEARLAASLAESEDLYNHAPCGYHSLDADGVYVRINQTELNWLGLTRDEVIGKLRHRDVLTPESQAVFDNCFPLLQRDGVLNGVEVDLVSRNAGTRRVSVSASVIRDQEGRFVMSRTVLHDVTELAEARRALEALAREQAAMLDNDLVGLVRVRGQAISWANAAAHRLFGFEPGHLVGQSLAALHPHGPEFSSVMRRASDAFAARQKFRTQIDASRRDGARIHVDVYGTALDPRGEDSLWALADLTPVRAAQQQLLQAQKMESAGRLAGGVAHDVNNMLQAILGTVELALAELPDDSSLAQDLAQIRESAQRSAALTQQLLAFARKQVIAPIPLDPNEAVERALSLLRRLLPDQAALEWRPGASAWTVRIDPALFEQALMNIVVNAWEALDAPGTVTIETQNRRLTPAEAEAYVDGHAGDFVCLIVRDTGRGMTPETLQRAFEPFFTTKAFGKNSGLGLSTVYGIATQHGGWPSLESEPGTGTTVTVFLPRHAEPVQRAAAADVPHRGTVLIVEDEPAIRRIAQSALTRQGFAVLSAPDADAALALASAHVGSIDLLLTDVVLPGSNGSALAETLRASRPALKVLYISGYSPEALEQRGHAEASANLLMKPFTLADLSARVQQVMGGNPPRA